MLFTSAKVGHLNILPQGEPEKSSRVLRMVDQMEREAFGNCTNHGACQKACPKEISVEFIARLNRDLLKASF
jgi:succinate dehydrogenase / fumarate reductase iron-sulfur subunit